MWRIALIAGLLLGLTVLMGARADEDARAELAKRWRAALDLAAKQGPTQLILAERGRATAVDLKWAGPLLDAARSLRVEENPTCRCMPRSNQRFVLILGDTSVLTFQVTSKHWFTATLIRDAQASTFILVDGEDRLVRLAAEVL